jgi:hypothetical protein
MADEPDLPTVGIKEAEKGQEHLSVDFLVIFELRGKSLAIHRYDEILWRIRTGYALLLYGATGIIAGLVNQGATSLKPSIGLAAIAIIVGFSIFGGLMDHYFMTAKMRVVKYRDLLTEIAREVALGLPLSEKSRTNLPKCLRNSGERDENVDWSNHTGKWLPAIYYGGTGLFCTIATALLMTGW